MEKAIYHYLFSLFLFRAAVRRNNSEIMLAARTNFSSLFYGLKQTSYQETDYRDLKMRFLAPEFIKPNEAFSVSGHPGKGEGGDFVLDNKNKRLKRLVPNGLPTETTWINACRSFDTLDDVSIYGSPKKGDIVTDMFRKLIPVMSSIRF